MIRKETIHPEGDNSVDIYPKTSYDQVEGRPDMSEYQLKSELESDIEELDFNKVIANPTEPSTNDLIKIKVGSTTYEIPQGTTVEANPIEPSIDDLIKIKIGSTTYEIPQGTTVEANPTETGTTDLTKLKVGNIVYNISSDGKLYSHEVQITWSDNNGYNILLVCFDSSSIIPINSVYDFMTLFNMQSRSDQLRVNYVGGNNDTFVGLVTSLYGRVANDNSDGEIYVTLAAGTTSKSISYTWESLVDSPYVTDIVSEW